ncbi:hypothetical protein JCM24511_01954 [Saitozyma sp. JCM 24511]|nr:hypothetical protein JCM24511_01954 [Saitozyma sp. JCM 24511]
MRHLTSLLVLILPFVVVAQNLSFPLHHRFVSSADTGAVDTDTRWFRRGTVFIDLDLGTGRFEETDGRGGTGGAVVLAENEGEWYQVGLGTGGDGIWPMSSTRACFLAHPSNARLTIHLSDSHPHPTSVTFAPLNVPRSGECPEGASRTGRELPHGRAGGRLWVDVVRPERMLGPALAGAPVVDASTGLPAAPPVEKSFLQKYWLPIAGLVLFAVSQMGPDEPRRGGGGAGAAGAGGR